MSAFIIPLPNNPALLELQEWLKTQLPEASEWVDPATFHITLVYSDEDMSAVQMPSLNLPMFGVAGMDLDSMETPDNTVVLYVSISKIPQLTHLQASVFYAVLAAGIKTSPFSWPGVYRPHISLAYVPKDKWNERWISSPTQAYLHVDRFVLSGENYAEVANYPLLVAAVDGTPISEMTRISDTLVIGEFGGVTPSVATFEEVDIAELTKGDTEPLFVVLPVAEDDSTSGNGRFYSAEFVAEIYRQMKEKRPTANLGHLSDEDRATAFPLPSAYWVGATKQGAVLWGKAYVPPGDVREMVRRLKAARGKLATSIYGTGNAEWNAKRGAWDVSAKEFILEHIDFAPPDRAGIGSLARVPTVVGEMIQEEEPVDKDQLIRELTAADVRLLPSVVTAAVVAESTEARTLAEMRTALGVDEKADLLTVVREMGTTIAEQKRVALEQTIISEVAANVLADAKQETDRVKAIRLTVVSLVKAGNPDSEAKVKEMVAQVIDRTEVKSMIETVVTAEMGPNQPKHGNKGQASGAGKEDPFFTEPEPAAAETKE